MKRIATILAPEDIGASGTKIIELNLSEQISRISMLWRCTNVTVSVMTAPVVDCLTKIELVDGSDVLFSLSGAEAQALNFYDQRVMPYNAMSLTVGGYFECEISIDFGRWLWDEVLAFVPGNFKNPQLRVTWDEDACNGSVVVNQFQVYAHVDDAPRKSPSGFLMAKEHYQYAMAASSHEYVDLPLDYPIRKLLLRGLSTDHDPILLFDTLKLSIDNDKFIPWNIKAESYYQIAKKLWPRIEEPITLDGVLTAKTVYANISRDQLLVIQPDDTAVTAAGENQAVSWTGAVAALSTGVAIQSDFAIITGTCPHNSIEIPFGDHHALDDALNVSMFGNVRADMLSSSDADSDDTTYLVTQQIRSY